GAAQMVGRVGSERGKRVLADDAITVEEARAGGADRHRPVSLGADHEEADPGMLAQPGNQARMERFDSLQAEPAGLTGKADQAETARGEDGELGQPVAVL